MKIIRKSSDSMTFEQSYKLTKDPTTGKMRDAIGSVLDIAQWIYYTDEQTRNGMTVETNVLALVTKDGTAYATNSATFIRDFLGMVDYAEDFGIGPDELPPIIIMGGKSKAGRDFVTCGVAPGPASH